MNGKLVLIMVNIMYLCLFVFLSLTFCIETIGQYDINTLASISLDNIDQNILTSITLEIISLHLAVLSCSGLHVNLAYKLVICVEFFQALDHCYIHRHSHISGHSLPCLLADKLDSILEKLDIIGPPSLSSSDVIALIVGLE